MSGRPSSSSSRRRPGSGRSSRDKASIPDYTPEFGKPMAMSAQLQGLQTRIKMLELVNEELLKAKSEFSFLTPYEFADLMKQSKIDVSKNFHDFGVNRLRKLEETLMKYVKQLAEARDLIETLSRAQAPRAPEVDPEELQALKDQLVTMKRAAKRNEAEKQSLREELEATRTELRAATTQVSDLQTTKAELTKKISDVQKRNSDFRSDLRDKSKQLQRADSEHAESKQALLKALSDVDDLRFKLDAGKTRRMKDAKLDAGKLKSAQASLTQKDTELAGKDTEISKLKTKIKDANTLAKQTRTELGMARTELEEHAVQLDGAHEEIRKLEATLRQERVERKNQLMWDQNSLREDLKAKANECQELRDELESVTVRLDIAQQQLAAATADAHSSRTQSSTEIADSKSKLAEAYQRITDLSDVRDELKADISALKKQHFNEQSDKKAEVTRLKQEVADLANRLHVSQDEANQYRADLQASQSDLKVYQTSGAIDPSEHRRILAELGEMTKREADGRVMITELQTQLEEEREERALEAQLVQAQKQRFR